MPLGSAGTAQSRVGASFSVAKVSGPVLETCSRLVLGGWMPPWVVLEGTDASLESAAAYLMVLRPLFPSCSVDSRPQEGWLPVRDS